MLLQQTREQMSVILHSPLKLDPEQALSLQDGYVQTAPFLLHVDGVVAWGDLHLATVHGTRMREPWRGEERGGEERGGEGRCG